MVNGAKIRELRKAENWTQKELADRTYSTQNMLAQIELGIKEPGVGLLKRIADAFGQPMESLLTEDLYK